MEISPLATTPATSNLFYRLAPLSQLKYYNEKKNHVKMRIIKDGTFEGVKYRKHVYFFSHIKLFKYYLFPVLIKCHNLSVLWNLSTYVMLLLFSPCSRNSAISPFCNENTVSFRRFL